MNLSVSTQELWINLPLALAISIKAILLDTNTLKYEMVPVKLDGYAVVIMNTNKRRELADSNTMNVAANVRALARLQKKLDIQALGDLDEATFEANMLIWLATTPWFVAHAVLWPKINEL